MKLFDEIEAVLTATKDIPTTKKQSLLEITKMAEQALTNLQAFRAEIPEGLGDAVGHIIVDPSTFADCKERSKARYKAASLLNKANGVEMDTTPETTKGLE